MVEFALLAGLLSVVAAVALPDISESIHGIFFWVREYLLTARGV